MAWLSMMQLERNSKILFLFYFFLCLGSQEAKDDEDIPICKVPIDNFLSCTESGQQTTLSIQFKSKGIESCEPLITISTHESDFKILRVFMGSLRYLLTGI